jgi:hypothetical protein
VRIVKPILTFTIMARKRKYSDEERIYRHAEAQREYVQKFPERRQKSYRISKWKRLGIVCSDWDSLYEHYTSTEKCEACGSDLDTGSFSSRKCLDHDHRTGQVRGVICEECNAVLRHYVCTDRLKLLIEYMNLNE